MDWLVRARRLLQVLYFYCYFDMRTLPVFPPFSFCVFVSFVHGMFGPCDPQLG